MPIDESDAKPTKGSKPNRGIRGRPTTTVRFTALRLADLRHDADAGRSVSEEVIQNRGTRAVKTKRK